MASDTRQLVIERVITSLKEERLRRGMSQNQVAHLAGLSHTMVMRVEKLERMPTIDTLLRMSAALDVELGGVITAANK